MDSFFEGPISGHLTLADVAAAEAFTSRYSVVINLADPVHGLTLDGVADDTAALLVLVASLASTSTDHEVVLPAHKTLRLTAPVNFRGVRRLSLLGDVIVDHNAGSYGIQVGFSSTTRAPAPIRLGFVTGGEQWVDIPIVRVVGLKNGDVTIGRCSYVQLYANEASSTISSIAYSKFHLGRIDKLELFGEPGTSWINENNFYGGSVVNLLFSGNYQHNGNKFDKLSVENGTMTLAVGARNEFNIRGEGATQVTFGAGTFDNIVIDHDHPQGVYTPSAVVVEDLGTGNQVVSLNATQMIRHEVVCIDCTALAFDESREIQDASTPPQPGFDLLTLGSSNPWIFDTGIVRVRRTGAPSFDLDSLEILSDQAHWRPSVFAYDETGTLIDPTVSPFMLTSGGWSAGSDGCTFSVNVSTARIILRSNANVSFIRIRVRAIGAPSLSFRFLRMDAHLRNGRRSTPIEQMRRQLRRPLYQASAPTKGIARPGQQIGNATGMFTCTSRADTTMVVAAVASDATITVASATGIVAGDLIGVLLDNGLTHWTKVSGAPSGAVVTLAAAMPSAAAIGRQVSANRWIAVT